MATLESIDSLLKSAAQILDEAAGEIRDCPLNPTEVHIHSIGEALVSIFQIQHEIYRLRPDLLPDHLKYESEGPDGKLTKKQKNIIKN